MSSMQRFRKLGYFGLLYVVLGVASGAALSMHAQSPQQPGPGVGEKSSPINAVPEKREQEKDETAAFRHSAAVQKLGRVFGMGPEAAATTFEVLNFVVLAVAVGFLGGRMLPRAFRDRSSAIQKNLVEARTATEEASARLRSVEARLARLDDEIAGMRQHLEADIAREEQRVKASIEDETGKIVAAADAEIQAATAAARRELQQHAAELAVQHAARRLTITPEADRQLVQNFAQRLVNGKGVQS